MLLNFTLETLCTIDDGRIKEAFEQALRRCESDLRDRPNMNKARTISLEAELVPVTDDAGALLEVKVHFQVKDRQPARETKTYHMSAARGGGLFYNELAPEDARQLTLDTINGPKTLERKDVHAG